MVIKGALKVPFIWLKLKNKIMKIRRLKKDYAVSIADIKLLKFFLSFLNKYKHSNELVDVEFKINNKLGLYYCNRSNKRNKYPKKHLGRINFR